MTFQIRYKDSNLFIFARIFKNDERLLKKVYTQILMNWHGYTMI